MLLPWLLLARDKKLEEKLAPGVVQLVVMDFMV